MNPAVRAGRIRWRRPRVAWLLVLCLLQAYGDSRATETPGLPDPAAELEQACRLPEHAITIPDDATASEAELLQSQSAVRDYDAAITEYTKCLADAAARLVALHPESAEALGIARADRNDAAVALA